MPGPPPGPSPSSPPSGGCRVPVDAHAGPDAARGPGAPAPPPSAAHGRGCSRVCRDHAGFTRTATKPEPDAPGRSHSQCTQNLKAGGKISGTVTSPANPGLSKVSPPGSQAAGGTVRSASPAPRKRRRLPPKAGPGPPATFGRRRERAERPPAARRQLPPRGPVSAAPLRTRSGGGEEKRGKNRKKAIWRPPERHPVYSSAFSAPER